MRKTISSKDKVRIPSFILIIGLVVFLVLIARLIQLNVSDTIDGINLKKFAKNRNTTKEILYASRGTIYDKNKEILAKTVDSYTVIAYLDKNRKSNNYVKDKRDTARKLAPLINMSEEDIYNLLNQDDLYQVELGPGGKGLTEIQKEKIEQLKLPGIDFLVSNKRYYPNQDFASYILGYTTKDDKGNTVGEMGIESEFNDKLTGINGSITYQKDGSRYKLANSPEIKIDKEDGYDIYLTIDSNVQLMAERALNNEFTASHAKDAIFVVAEAKTGKIIASAAKPSFDPNLKNITNYLNPLVSNSFEPGSTMKTYTYMATMEKGNYDGNAKYQSGTMELSGYTIKDWNGYGWGNITYDYGYTQSSNIGVANLMQHYLTGDELHSYLNKLGFGKKTGIELPGEDPGQIKFKYDIEVANASFGQGIKTTPIQHIKALTSISNDGYILNPTIIDKIVDPNTNKVIYAAKKQKGYKVANINTVNHIKDLMYQVVNGSGTGTDFHLDGYNIIGKTGTAEVYNDSEGDYYSSYVHSIRSFAGMYPKDNPKYVFYIAFRDIDSSIPMSNAVKSFIQDLETYYNLTNVKVNKKSIVNVDNYLNRSTNDVKNILNNNNISYEIIGNGDRIINQYPLKGNLIDGKLILLTNGEISEINLNGLSSKEVNNYCSMININCNIKGSGYVNNFKYIKDKDGKITGVDINLDQKYKDVIGSGISEN